MVVDANRVFIWLVNADFIYFEIMVVDANRVFIWLVNADFIYFEIMVVDANRVFIWLVNADFICHICTIYNALVYDLLTLVGCRPVASVLETVHVPG